MASGKENCLRSTHRHISTLWNKWGLTMKRMGRAHPFLWIWVVAEEWLGQNSFCVVPKLLFAPVMDKVPCFLSRFSSLQAQGTCVGSEQSSGILLMDWIIYLSEGRGRCASESSNLFSVNRSGCEVGLSPAYSCQCRQTSEQAVCRDCSVGFCGAKAGWSFIAPDF